MKNIKKLIIFSFLFSLPFSLFAGKIRGIPAFDTQEMYENGGLILFLQKSNRILMYNTTPKADHYCNFFVEITNDSPSFETFYVKDLIVTDQFGRNIPIKDKKIVLKNKKNAFSLDKIFLASSESNEIYNAKKHAGKIKYKEIEIENTRVNIPQQNSNLNMEAVRVDTTRAIQNKKDIRQENPNLNMEAVRVDTNRAIQNRRNIPQENSSVNVQTVKEVEREFVDEVARDNEIRRIQSKYQQLEEKLHREEAIAIHNAENYYIDNHTLRPGETYGANFQILIPKEINKTLKEIIITYSFAGEEYKFLYKVEN